MLFLGLLCLRDYCLAVFPVTGGDDLGWDEWCLGERWSGMLSRAIGKEKQKAQLPS